MTIPATREDLLVDTAEERLKMDASSVANGDVGAFRHIVLATTPSLFRTAVRLTASREVAKNALQQTYLLAYESMCKRKSRGDSGVQSWLRLILVNVAMTQWKEERRLGRNEIVSAVPSHHLLDAPAAATPDLTSLLRRLPDEQRAALILRELEEFSRTEAAAILVCSPGAIDALVLRARTSLIEWYTE